MLSFNLWVGGDAGKQPLDRTVEVIKRSQADIVGLQETGGMRLRGSRGPIAPPKSPNDSDGTTSTKVADWNH